MGLDGGGMRVASSFLTGSLCLTQPLLGFENVMPLMIQLKFCHSSICLFISPVILLIGFIYSYFPSINFSGSSLSLPFFPDLLYLSPYFPGYSRGFLCLSIFAPFFLWIFFIYLFISSFISGSPLFSFLFSLYSPKY